MDSVLRAAMMYVVLLIVFRVAGKRSLVQTTPFDLLLLLIISESVQNAMVGDDYSLTNSALIIITLVGLDIALSFITARSERADRWLDDVPLLLVVDGQPLLDRLRRTRTDLEDILQSARATQGLERLDQIRFAVLERSGEISIVPKQSEK
jgi:uncharacterized membrane protein YcaP (DUF421 family)